MRLMNYIQKDLRNVNHISIGNLYSGDVVGERGRTRIICCDILKRVKKSHTVVACLEKRMPPIHKYNTYYTSPIGATKTRKSFVLVMLECYDTCQRFDYGILAVIISYTHNIIILYPPFPVSTL